MQRSASEVEAANGALAHVGQAPIASLDQRTAAAIAARSRFADVRDALLREKDWNFASAWVVPAALDGAAAGPLRHRYPMPDDCLGIRSVNGSPGRGWAIEAAGVNPGEEPSLSTVLVTNADAPRVNYTRRVESPAEWDALFLDVFQLRLGSALAALIARNMGLAENLEARAESRLGPASRRDARERSVAFIPRDTSWLRARGGFAPPNTWPWPHGWPPDGSAS